MKHVLWVVEMKVYYFCGYRWEPTVGVALTRNDCRNELKEWKFNNPTDKFRIRKYVSESNLIEMEKLVKW